MVFCVGTTAPTAVQRWMVMGMRRHSTATLMGMTKKELVEYVRMAEHNQDVAEETLNQQAENVKDWIPVVRCKDCKHWCDSWVAPDGKHEHGYCHMEESDDVIVGRWDDDFCSYGERKDNG
jgi:hypothetical protein